MQVVLLLGVGVAAFTLMIILKYGVAVQMVNQCLVYTNPVGGGFWIRSAYVIATCAAFFISSHLSVRVIGTAMVVGFAVAYSFFRLNYPSVWCFFAALVSALTYWHFRRKKTGDVKETLTV
jgi:choline-glycine betaine transporter